MDAAPCLPLAFPGGRRSWRFHRVMRIPHELRAVGGALAQPLAGKQTRYSPSLPRPRHVPSQVVVKQGGAFAQVTCMTFPHATDRARRPEEAGHDHEYRCAAGHPARDNRPANHPPLFVVRLGRDGDQLPGIVRCSRPGHG